MNTSGCAHLTSLVPLTAALYSNGAFDTVTFIGSDFIETLPNKNVTLPDMVNLECIGDDALTNTNVNATGSYPALRDIGTMAFSYTTGIVDMTAAPALSELKTRAFYNSEAKLIFKGEYPSLNAIGESVFRLAQNPGSTLVFTDTAVPNLEIVGQNAFAGFGGNLTTGGTYPNLWKLWPSSNFGDLTDPPGTSTTMTVTTATTPNTTSAPPQPGESSSDKSSDGVVIGAAAATGGVAVVAAIILIVSWRRDSVGHMYRLL